MARAEFRRACDALGLATDPRGVQYADDVNAWHVVRHAPGDRVYWAVWGNGREIMVGLSTRELYYCCDFLARMVNNRIGGA